ncbi:MAG: ABC transporter ATP-binding protein [Bacteroidota bacterium]|nr:ABC transporter ATP-binding protein [Bacteroidota bacterium]
MQIKLIEARGLTKKFGEFTAIDKLDFEVFGGEIFGFLGANGAGKTTAIKILCGLSYPSSGEVNVAGFDVYTQTEQLKLNIGYMSQRFSLYEDLTIYENIRFYGGIYGIGRKELHNKSEQMIRKFGLVNEKNSLISDIPLGWKQKIAFSIAILHDPKIIFLDEPTGGVDPITRRQFWDLIYEVSGKGMTVFVTTHYMDEAEYCNRVSIMDEGKIVAIDTPNNLKSSFEAANMDEVFVKIARGPK